MRGHATPSSPKLTSRERRTWPSPSFPPPCCTTSYTLTTLFLAVTRCPLPREPLDEDDGDGEGGARVHETASDAPDAGTALRWIAVSGAIPRWRATVQHCQSECKSE